MTAKEALELSKADAVPKRPWFNLRLAWICGKINHEIEKQAEYGNQRVYCNMSKKCKKKYFKYIKKLYMDLGYEIFYDSFFENIKICWDRSERR